MDLPPYHAELWMNPLQLRLILPSISSLPGDTEAHIRTIDRLAKVSSFSAVHAAQLYYMATSRPLSRDEIRAGLRVVQ